MNVDTAQTHNDAESATALMNDGSLGTYTPLTGIESSALADEVSVVHNAGAAVQAGVGGTRVDAHLAVGPDVQGVAFAVIT